MILDRKNYFSPEAESLYLGSSSYKAFDVFHGGCEAKELAKLKGEWQEESKDAFLLGSYVHSWNSGDLQEFIMDHPEMFKKNGEIYAKYELGDTMINTLKNDKMVQKIREGAEMERIFTGAIGGVAFKIQVDILNIEKGYFADIKTTKNLQEIYYNTNKKCRETFIDKYDYYSQFAIYAEILRQNLGMVEGEYLEPYVIVVDKQTIPDHTIIDMGTGFIKDKLEEMKERLPRIMSVRKGENEAFKCGKCDYCKSKKQAKIITLDEYKEELNIYE